MYDRQKEIQSGSGSTSANGPGYRGFTLVELLVVMAIIATLLSIVAPKYFNSLDRSKETVLRQNLECESASMIRPRARSLSAM